MPTDPSALEPDLKVFESLESVVILSVAVGSGRGSCHVDGGIAHPA